MEEYEGLDRYDRLRKLAAQDQELAELHANDQGILDIFTEVHRFNDAVLQLFDVLDTRLTRLEKLEDARAEAERQPSIWERLFG